MTPQEHEAFNKVEKAIKNIEQAYDAGFVRGRLQGIKEMDDAWMKLSDFPFADPPAKLRKEYQQPN